MKSQVKRIYLMAVKDKITFFKRQPIDVWDMIFMYYHWNSKYEE